MKEESKVEIVVPPKGRLIWGGIVFVSGFLAPLLIPWVLSLEISTGMKSLISGLLALGIPELFMLIAVGILGKSGYEYLKQKVFAVFKKYGPPDEVSPLRYGIGLIMFWFPILIALLLPYIAPFTPEVEKIELWIFISGDVILLLSLFVLGGNFWDKLRGLFIRRAKINFESN
jgi:hypothetical protein